MKKNNIKLSYKPYTPSRRFMTREDYSEITQKTPHKKLLINLKKHAGRDKTGTISVHHRGGGSKRKFRIISHLNDKINIPATVLTVEYDPNRSARIMLVQYEDKQKAYILAPSNIKIGDVVIGAHKAKISNGNRMKLENIPTGTTIYDIQCEPFSKKSMVRSAGTSAILLAQAEGEGKRSEYIQIKLPSGEVRLIHKECFASIGQVSNPNHSSVKIGKAGRSRWMGIRPTVRGKAKNPVDHPHGGGEGGNSIGLKYPKTPWGKPALGKITRRNKRTNKFIVKKRFEK